MNNLLPRNEIEPITTRSVRSYKYTLNCLRFADFEQVNIAMDKLVTEECQIPGLTQRPLQIK